MPTVLMFLMYVFAIQPSYGYSVTSDPQAVTYYSLANANEGTDVLLAHEKLAGKTFFELDYGDLIQMDYPSGMQLYKVAEIKTYLALDPFSEWSYFKDNETGMTYASDELPSIVYRVGWLTLQTCYDNSRDRLFVIAERIEVWNEWKYK